MAMRMHRLQFQNELKNCVISMPLSIHLLNSGLPIENKKENKCIASPARQYNSTICKLIL